MEDLCVYKNLVFMPFVAPKALDCTSNIFYLRQRRQYADPQREPAYGVKLVN